MNQAQRGFTLAEVLVSIVIGSMIGGLLVAILVNNTGLYYKQSSKVTQGVGINDSLQSISAAIKGAASVAVGYPEVGSTYTTGSSILVLKLPSLDSSDQVISNAFDYTVFVVENNNLKIKVFPSTTPASSRKSKDTILTKNVKSLKFNYYDSSGSSVSPVSAVKVVTTITLNQKAGADSVTNIATSEASLRND